MLLWMIAVALSITGVLHYTTEQWMFLTVLCVIYGIYFGN